MSSDCPFCKFPEPDLSLTQGSLWHMRWDKYPVSKGHILLTPKRHIRWLTELNKKEWNELPCMIALALEANETREYNLGINQGESAGQTVEHLHIHIIPRHEGDCDNPRGGVRKVKEPLVQY